MPSTTTPTDPARTPLSPARVIGGAVALADRIGIEPFTIRKLAAELDVKPMAIYHHLANKDAIVDGMVDHVFDEIDLPPTDLDWTAAIRVRCVSARAALARHPWATPLMETRTSPGPATLAHHDAVIGCLRRGGLSWTTTAHAYAILDSFVYGFALQEATLPFNGEDGIGEVADAILEPLPEGDYPNLVAFTVEHVLVEGYSFGRSFEFGLDLLLEGIGRMTD